MSNPQKDHQPSSKIDVDDVVEGLGFGWFQWKLLIICGLGSAADGMEMIAVSFLLVELKREWNLTPSQLGFLGASSFIGMLVGATFWGLLSDRIGRKFAFQATVLIVSLSGLASAFAPNVSVMIGLRMLLGFGLGGNLPIDFSMFMEYTPLSKRGFFSTILSAAWSFGEIFSCVIALLTLEPLGWRYYLFANSWVGILVFFARRGIPESPRYLIVVNDHEGAWRSLEQVAKDNHRELPPREMVYIPPPERSLSAIHLLSPALIRVSFLLWVIWFMSSVNLYGLFLFMPTYMSLNGSDSSDIVADTLVSSMVEIPGVFCAALLVDRIGRRSTLTWGFGLAGATTLLFGFMTTRSGMVLVLMVTKFVVYAVGAGLYTFTPEVYPTALRTTGMGAASCMTRLGGITTPFIGEALIHESAFASIVVWAAAGFVAAICSHNLPFDTLSRKLEDSLAATPHEETASLLPNETRANAT
eukprot:c5355_g1_i1.p1 GENE.c5355_g1_i1~~c5355_g1_i1.p1  ORF type:complete len:482 (+),score=98.59 c5355_g1_i1:34-1446(+)